MHIGRTRSVSGLGALSAACVKGTVLAITLLAAVASASRHLEVLQRHHWLQWSV